LQHRHGKQDPGVPGEVNPFDVEGPEDAACVGSSQRKNVDLDHLRNVFEEVARLGDHKHVEHCKPLICAHDDATSIVNIGSHGSTVATPTAHNGHPWSKEKLSPWSATTSVRPSVVSATWPTTRVLTLDTVICRCPPRLKCETSQKRSLGPGANV